MNWIIRYVCGGERIRESFTEVNFNLEAHLNELERAGCEQITAEPEAYT